MLDLLKRILEKFKDECLKNGYEMLLEADVVGNVFRMGLK
jgi:hypothetical protein